MRLVHLTLTSLCLVLTASIAMAKDKEASSPDPQAMMQKYMELATPGEPHRQLVSLAGNWTTKTKSWMEPDKPPMESTGTCEYKVLLDGRYVQQQCSGEMMGQPFTGIGTHGYDNLTKKYVTTWIDSMGTGIFSMEGTAGPDGKTITLKGSHPDPFEGVMHHRAIWKFVDANTQIFEMYGEHGHGHEMKVMEITYTRK
ncbi:MAG: DUF1579 domain-containing protein [Nitrospiraceae bacterium]|nr:DUF1579 domain-containing protein [Nitrospiraceae bacterium]